MFIYHYHATKQLPTGGILAIDGIAQLQNQILTMSDYNELKVMITSTPGPVDIGGTVGLTVCSLALLHTSPNTD